MLAREIGIRDISAVLEISITKDLMGKRGCKDGAKVEQQDKRAWDKL